MQGGHIVPFYTTAVALSGAAEVTLVARLIGHRRSKTVALPSHYFSGPDAERAFSGRPPGMLPVGGSAFWRFSNLAPWFTGHGAVQSSELLSERRTGNHMRLISGISLNAHAS